VKPNPHRGRWQAQGDDIKKPKGGHSVPWNQAIAPTKEQGVQNLTQLYGLCEAQQRKLRATVFKKAERYVHRAPPEGYPASGKNKPFYVDPQNPRYPDARIDLDIKAGMAFTDEQHQ
jgi:hypothetical protein